MRKTLALAALAAGLAAGLTAGLADGAEAADRSHIMIVGSSTVYPFSTVVAERFAKTTGFRAPVVEATGSGGGLKLFCAGVGLRHPDIANASRAIKQSEIDACKKNGVTGIIEIKVGYDGIVLGNTKKAERFSLTKRQIFLALAKQIPGAGGGFKANDNMTWKDIGASLPDTKIEVYGPPPTSGTRDAFVELAMEGGCITFDEIAALEKSDKNRFKALCHSVREDGPYVEAGENDNLIVQKLEENPRALGIFGFSFLDQNADKIQGSIIDGGEPEFETIAEGGYTVSRPLFMYVKKAHAGTAPGIREYLAEFTSDKAWGDEGYLTDKGLIPMPEDERGSYAADAKNLTVNVGN
ncbi:MAG: substrate-binding domain-containing protein [Rhodospirillales bacterium]